MKKEDYRRISMEHFARQVQVNVITLTNDFIVSKTPNALHEHSLDFDHPLIVDGIAFVFCVAGTAKIRINLMEHDTHRNSLLVIVPNSIIQVMEQSEDLKIEFLFFMFDFISNIRLTTQLGYIVKAVEERACLHLDKEAFNELLAVHELIVRQYQKGSAYREEIIKNFLYALIYQILHLYATNVPTVAGKGQNRKEDIYMRFMVLLFEHYRNERSVRFYADKLFMTPKHFSKVIRETSGRPVLEWIDEMVIMAAKAMLKSSDMTVTQVAYELNFASASFFGTYFRKRVGMTPVKYRAQ